MPSVIQKRYIGLSTDVKPADGTVSLGDLFDEQDTGRRWFWAGFAWEFQQSLWSTVSTAGALYPPDDSLQKRLAETNSLLRCILRVLSDGLNVDYSEETD